MTTNQDRPTNNRQAPERADRRDTMMSNASIFRRYARAEESMIRASMPRTSAASPEPLAPRPTRRTWTAGSLVVKTSFTLAEVAHAA